MASSSVGSDGERSSPSEVLAASGRVSARGDVGDGERGVPFSAMSNPVIVVSLGGDTSGVIGEATTAGVPSPVADSLSRSRCSKAQWTRAVVSWTRGGSVTSWEAVDEAASESWTAGSSRGRDST